MRKAVLLAVVAPLALAACEDYGTKGTPYGDYQLAREAALQGRGPAPTVVPVTLPVNAPTPEMIAGAPVVVVRKPVAASAVVAAGTAPAAIGEPDALRRFAISAHHRAGTPVWPRPMPDTAKAARLCAGYASPEAAQRAFLAAGRPQIDVTGIDPDGDGYVCGWDPRPLRASGL